MAAIVSVAPHVKFVGELGACIAYRVPASLVHADPVVRVVALLIEEAAKPGGHQGHFLIRADAARVGAAVRFVLDDVILVYRVVALDCCSATLEWPD